MKKTSIIILLATISIASSAQYKTQFGIYVGGTTASIKDPARDDNIKKDWNYSMPVGGRVGIDLKIPLFAGLYLKPGLYGEYFRDYRKKESIQEGDLQILKSAKGIRFEYEDIHYKNTYRKSNQDDDIAAFLPLSLGYRFNVAEKVSISVGLLGYARYLITSRHVTDDSTIYASTPYREKYNKTVSNKDEINLLKDIDLFDFKTRISYGAGVETEAQFGSFFLRYQLNFPVYKGMFQKKEQPAYNIRHALCLGVYF